MNIANLGLDLKGKIADGPAEGRAVARLTDLGHGQALRELFATRAEPVDGPVPPGLVQAVLEVLGDWPEAREVGSVAYVDSTTRPQLVRDLASGVSRRLGVPIVARMAVADPEVEPGRGAANSARRVAAVQRRYELQRAPDRESVAGTVLLLDDLQVTGWTLTVAARALRGAGADAVLPLTLGLQA